MLQDFLPSSKVDPRLVALYLKLPCAIQSKISTYYLSYGTVISHAMRAENGNGKCMDDELTIWRPGFENRFRTRFNKAQTVQKKQFVLRESLGFTSPVVFFYMRLAMTVYENHHTRFYLNETIRKITKERLLKLIAEEPVNIKLPPIFTNICGV